MSIISLQGKTFVVTGAASGIGLRTAEMLIGNGAEVIGLDRNPLPSGKSQFVHVDMGDPATIDAAVDTLRGMALDGLCNIAGVPGTVPNGVVARVNYLGLVRLTRGLLPQLSKGASIVHLASMAGFMWRERARMLWELAQIEDWDAAQQWIAQHPEMADQAYRKFKEALIVWMMGNANAWMQRFGVRMNSVSPGPVATPILDDFKRSLGQQNVADILERTGRAATPDDIASVVVFLLSDASRWIVGVDLPTEGGLTASRFVSAMQQPVASDAKGA